MMIKLLSSTLTGLSLLCLFVSTIADKDDSYYITGTGNPNVNEKLYWKDAENVLQDLSEFSALYVTFDSCAWSWMQTSDPGNDVDENDYWYMGKIPPMGANVAYSLYGQLKGSNFIGCTENTFINSFYTNSGFTDFARAMKYSGMSGFSSYAGYSYADDDSYSSSSVNAECKGGYGVGCDYNNGFAIHTYSGDACDPSNVTGVKDSLSSLNSAMKKAQCIKIYDSSSNSYGYTSGTGLELLEYSHSCFYQDYFSPDGDCPDPYGKLKYYQNQFHSGIQESKRWDPYQLNLQKEAYLKTIEKGKIYSGLGAGLAGLAILIFLWDICMTCWERPRRKKGKKLKTNKEIPEGRPDEDLLDDIEESRTAADSMYQHHTTSQYAPPDADTELGAPRTVVETDRPTYSPPEDEMPAPASEVELVSQPKPEEPTMESEAITNEPVDVINESEAVTNESEPTCAPEPKQEKEDGSFYPFILQTTSTFERGMQEAFMQEESPMIHMPPSMSSLPEDEEVNTFTDNEASKESLPPPMEVPAAGTDELFESITSASFPAPPPLFGDLGDDITESPIEEPMPSAAEGALDEAVPTVEDNNPEEKQTDESPKEEGGNIPDVEQMRDLTSSQVEEEQPDDNENHNTAAPESDGFVLSEEDTVPAAESGVGEHTSANTLPEEEPIESSGSFSAFESAREEITASMSEKEATEPVAPEDASVVAPETPTEGTDTPESTSKLEGESEATSASFPNKDAIESIRCDDSGVEIDASTKAVAEADQQQVVQSVEPTEESSDVLTSSPEEDIMAVRSMNSNNDSSSDIRDLSEEKVESPSAQSDSASLPVSEEQESSTDTNIPAGETNKEEEGTM